MNYDQNKLREALADYAHDAWSGWMQHLFSKGLDLGQFGYQIMPEQVERWRRQMTTQYGDLPAVEQASDRIEADRILGIVGRFQDA